MDYAALNLKLEEEAQRAKLGLHSNGGVPPPANGPGQAPGPSGQ